MGSYKIKDGLTPMLKKLVGKPSQITNRIARDMRSEIELRFRNGETPEGIKWKPSLRGGKTLVDTGILRQSFQIKFRCV